jgi:ShK domain-like
MQTTEIIVSDADMSALFPFASHSLCYNSVCVRLVWIRRSPIPLQKVVEFCSPACRTCDEYLERFYPPAPIEKDETQPEESMNPRIIKLSMWGVPQHMVEGESEDKVNDILEATRKYMVEKVLADVDFFSETALEECENKDADCTYWAATGMCNETRAYMQVHCAPACGTCEMIDYSNRCPVPEGGGEALKGPGDLNSIFERIVADEYWAENHGPVEVLSSPQLNNGPWILTMEKFLSAEECNAFISAAEHEGYHRSEDVGDVDWDGTLLSVVESSRTSVNAWCYEGCIENPLLKPVHERLEKLTGIHNNHSEFLQLLKYEEGQFYDEQ